jgi:hypothetical protein
MDAGEGRCGAADARACDRDDGSIDSIDRSTPESIRFDSIRWIPFDGFRSMDSIRSRMMSIANDVDGCMGDRAIGYRYRSNANDIDGFHRSRMISMDVDGWDGMDG